jgi:hypothetical protein
MEKYVGADVVRKGKVEKSWQTNKRMEKYGQRRYSGKEI